MNNLRRVAILVLVMCLLFSSAYATSFKAKTASSCKIYASPKTSSASKNVSGGVQVKVVACNRGWAKIKIKDMTAFIKTGKLKPSEGSKKENVVALAMMQLGKSYGNDEPSSFNCSSLINYCYGKYGVHVRGSAKEIANDDSLATVGSVHDLKTGDIVCFDTKENGTCDHVGLYIGDSQFIEASQGAGKVQVNKMNSWYKRHFICGKRI